MIKEVNTLEPVGLPLENVKELGQILETKNILLETFKNT